MQILPIMLRIIKIKNKKWTYLLMLFLTSHLVNCNPKANESRDKEQEGSELILYYKKNNWEYPIEIDTSAIRYDKNIEIGNKLIPAVLKQKIFDWCVSDSILAKHSNDQSIRIYAVNLSPVNKFKHRLTCRIDFYREGEIKDGAVAPVEGHGIVENKFLRQKEIAVFILDHDTLIFSNWKQ
jgi:hypothetical protein